ncbi:MAG: methylenetetrahydrofolate reductase [NAD(P)H], partial [Pseudomonadales bacterium]|nr:methylenetetrahydrofolate reductase [NAD(P)H] [Pseudomonadales bacterium]
KTDAGMEKFRVVRSQLAELKPEFFSVTYGAGGSTQDRTLNTVLESQRDSGIPTAPHLSCVGDTRESLRELITNYKEQGINRIVALRGDLPSGMGASGELTYASDLVQFIREETGDHFHLEVAAYPEIHPQAATAGSDLAAFKAKVDAGADSAITQYFFNIEAYHYFMDMCEKVAIDIPIVPGIMPITNFTNLARFSDMCGAEIPRWIRRRLEGYGDDLESIKLFGEEVVTRLVETLLDNGAPGIHFYTMNQAKPMLAIWDNLSLGDIE